jgi:uncharacterized protein (DUF697 family)
LTNPCYGCAVEISGGKLAMWVIGGGILLGLTAGLIARGVDKFPFHWGGIIGALVLAGVAFALGEYE